MSAVHKYYRKISENVDNIKNSIDIASLLVKSQEVDSKIEANESNISSNLSDINDNKNNISSNLKSIGEKSDIIEDNKTNISDNLSLINTNKSNVFDNLSLINTNKSNISDNLSLINTNKSNVSDNLSLINTNKSNISDNLKLINDNKSNVSDNLSLINTNRSNVSDNLKLINDNKTYVSDNLSLRNTNMTTLNNIDLDLTNLRGRINTHQDDIQKLNEKVYNLSDCYKLKHFIRFDTVNNINKAININSPKFSIIKNDVVFDFKKGSYIECHLSILLFFVLHYINIQFFHILLQLFDDQNNLFKEIRMPLIGQISKYAILTNYCVTMIPNDYNKIYFELSIVLKNGQNRSDIIKIMDFDNYVYFKIYEK